MSWKQYFKREQRFWTSLKWATFSIWKFLICCWWNVSFPNSKKSKSLFFILFPDAGGYVSSVNAFLFSLKNKDNLKPFKAVVNQNSAYAFVHSYNGPTFGAGWDLHISNNANLNTVSFTYFGSTYQPPPGYTYRANNTIALLAGTFHFTPSEVEVFYLQ